LKAKLSVLQETFAPNDEGNAEFFVPGYFIYEGLLVWTSLLADTKTVEEGGRIDYSLLDKINDLKALREGIAITGWSSGLVQPHLEQLNTIILKLEMQQRMITAPTTSFFSEYLNMSPAPDSPGFPTPNYQAAYANTFPGSREATNSSQIGVPDGSAAVPSGSTIQEIMQSAAPRNEWSDGPQTGSHWGAPDGAQSEMQSTDDMPSAEYIDQFLRSIGFANPIVDTSFRSSM
jgi:hypothetical protein